MCLRVRRLPRRHAVIAAATVLALVAAIGTTLIASAAAAAPTWSDDFDGPAGSAPDPAKWVRETGGSGSGNNELQYYTDGASNAALDGQGHLVITARRENPAGYQCWYGDCRYTSARLNTAERFTQMYGRIEARIKIPRGQGIWPAFWMLGDNIGSVGWPASGEIDIMENIGSEPNLIHGSLHGPGYSGGSSLSGGYDAGRPFADDFHTYAVDWAPDAVTFSVDGNQYQRRTPADTRGNAWVFNRPYFLILNLAVGGNWPGAPDAGTVFPQQMVVDYVRVHSNPRGGQATPPGTTAAMTGGSGDGPRDAPSHSAGGARTGTILGYWGNCVNVDSGRRTNGTAVRLHPCDGTDAQQWIRSGRTLRAFGKCLDVAHGGTVDGTRVVLWDCNGAAAQDWAYTDGELINVASGRCLDALDQASDDTMLQIWSCHGGPDQRWLMANSDATAAPTATPTLASTPARASTPAPSRTATPRTATSSPGAMAAAPYLYLGWGSPPDPRTVMSATGVRWFTLAFMLGSGGCTPRWDGNRPLTGGQDQTAINNIRAAGGDVVVSFGGASGPSLEQSCDSAEALAGAYRQVIDAYVLRAIDVDIEGGVYGNPTAQQRVIDALKLVKASRHGVTVYVTIPSDRSGPDSSMIRRAAAAGLVVDGWTIMPFDFGAVGQDMGALTIQAAGGLKNTIKSAYGLSDDEAYRHAGISSMNGKTDAGETVTPANLTAVLAYAQHHHLARFTFWSINRDRPCNGGGSSDNCSGVSQAPWEFTRIVARYTG
jgi:beta-glucanase (GH16 family)